MNDDTHSPGGKGGEGGAGEEAASFLAGGGEMGALMRAHDWSASSLGPPPRWSQSLRTSVRLMLNTGHPMYIFWGPQLGCLYNDAYRASIGPERHPGSLGRPAREVWDETWPVIGPQIEQVMSGRGATWHVDQLVPITRHGRREDAYWTYSYSPIDDPAAPGGVGGVLVVCSETTRQVRAAGQVAAERDQLAQLFEQAPTFMALLRGAEHRFELANPAYLKLVGYRPLLGRTVAEALPDAAAQGYIELLDRVFRSGEAYTANAARYEMQPVPGGPVHERFVDFVYHPMRQGDGSVGGIFVVGADVTERMQSVAALRKSEASFRSALVAGRMGSWETDFVAGTRHWSHEGMELFGLDLPDGRGQVGGENDEFVAALHPAYRHLVPQFHRLARQQDSFAAEYRIVRPDGSTLWLSGRGLVVQRGRDGRAQRLVSIMADTTERKQAEEVLRVERERLDLALSAGQMGAYDLNIEADVLWWSPQTYAVFGVSPDTFTPTRDAVAALLHPDDRDTFLRLRAEALANRHPFALEFRILRPDGALSWVDHRGQAEYDEQGRALRSFGVVMDITARKRIEETLKREDQKKDNFIATLAHELRNPLAPIRNAVNVLRRSVPGDAQVAWCYGVIDRQATQMAHLLDDLLDVSRINRGELQLRPRPLRLAAVIDQAIEIAKPLIDAGQHRLTLKLPAQELHIEGDLTRLAQVFANVLINAAKYTPTRGRIELSAAQQGDDAVVKVVDSGIGIAAEHLTQIFEMFGQVQSALNRSQGGQGIGLALAKGLLEMHGGTIGVRSEGPGLGSEFEIRLPLMPQEALGAPPPVAAAAAKAPGAGLRVLIADDLPDIADSLAMLLEEMGHQVSVAYDGEQALQVAERQRPQVVLLDLGMPKINGYEACRRIRAAPWSAGMTLIAQTGWGGDEDRRRTVLAGFDHHVIKPVDPQALLALLARTR